MYKVVESVFLVFRPVFTVYELYLTYAVQRLTYLLLTTAVLMSYILGDLARHRQYF